MAAPMVMAGLATKATMCSVLAFPRSSGGLKSLNQYSCSVVRRFASETSASKNPGDEDEEFRVLNLNQTRQPRRTNFKRRGEAAPIPPPRYTRMPIDQNWGNVWPASKSFHPASVPLPIRMGYSEKGVAPGKFANAELMKIPNFLHLTPPVVARQCEALKKFCTPWPEALKTEEDMRKHFPLEYASCDYLHSSSTIRDPNSRIITLKYKVSDLKLDKRSHDKYLRLVGDRYNPKTDTVTIVVDRCPSRTQNRDFARYVFSVLYMEATQIEDWESEKTRADLEEFMWSGSGCESRLLDIIKGFKASNSCPQLYSNFPAGDDLTAEAVSDLEAVQNYSAAIKGVLEGGETEENWDTYKAAVLQVLDVRAEASAS